VGEQPWPIASAAAVVSHGPQAWRSFAEQRRFSGPAACFFLYGPFRRGGQARLTDIFLPKEETAL
jgi:hypothetical protein